MSAAGRPQVLVLRALGLGDLLTAVPASRAVRRASPDAHVVLAAPAGLAPLASLTGAVDEVLPAAGLAPLRWDRPPPAVAVNLHGRGPESHRVLDALAPVRRIGFAAPGWDGPAWSDGEHEVDRWCRLLLAAGVDADPTDLLLPRPAADPPVRDAVVVHPGAAYGCRRWPAARFAAVAADLARDGATVVVTGSAQERPLAAGVAERAGLPPGAVLAGRTGVLDLAALVAHARLVVCGDTGVAHLATAFGTPSALLFGPVPPEEWGPRTDGPHEVRWHGDAVCGDRWAAAPDPALLAVTVEETLAACAAAVARGRAGVRG